MSRVNFTLNRRHFLAHSAAAGAVAAHRLAFPRPSQAAATPPNIVYILADDLGYGDLGCYGQKRIQTPNIDRFAAEGIRFTDHYAGSTVCAPSRCCLMTGLHTGHAFIRGNDRIPLPPEEVTVAEILEQSGYTTGIVGKWGLGEPDTTGIPNKQGFDYWFGYLNQRHAHNYYPEFLFRNEERVTVPGNVIDKPGPVGEGIASKKVTYSHDLFAEEALGFLRRNRSKPFFLYLALTIPHANNEAGDDGMEVPTDAPYSNEKWPQNEKNHAAMVTRMDSDIGRLMALLKELGLDENTVVFFTSDNGPHREGGHDPDFFDSNGPFRGIKRDLYDGGIRVPMIVRWPGKIIPGAVTGHVSAFWDFLPTACDLAKVEAPDGIDGISFLPALIGGQQKSHRHLYWEFHEGAASKQAVRMGRWKGVRLAPSKPVELYDIVDAPGETTDIAGANPDIVASITALMTSSRSPNEHWKLLDK